MRNRVQAERRKIEGFLSTTRLGLDRVNDFDIGEARVTAREHGGFKEIQELSVDMKVVLRELILGCLENQNI